MTSSPSLPNFDTILDRRASDSIKWNRFEKDVLPLWVADMDFSAPEPVLRALRERLRHGIFGYPQEVRGSREAVLSWLERRHDWRVDAEALVFLPGVVTGFNLALQALGNPGERALVQPPTYRPLMEAPRHASMFRSNAPLVQDTDGRYCIDFDAFEAAITPETRFFLLCNPHNPTGRVFRRDELERMAETCLRHDLVIISDEIHHDLTYSGHKHIPIASLDPEIAAHTITLIAPSKTFNIAGLKASVAIIPNKNLRKRYEAARRGLVDWVNLMGQIALRAAYGEGDSWLDALLHYLEANREYLFNFVHRELPGVRMAKPEGTFLAWLDCRQANIQGNPAAFFLKHARVALNEGKWFGSQGKGFVRLNFGCPRATLKEALERMKAALTA
ncbi:MAG: pyridoxal phosphate-dependent aminotransferase [Anaerolineae bacterium]|nr:MAG: pyridoxal phosphate-dependent aminotransferase [Anaerolineae bacterium]